MGVSLRTKDGSLPRSQIFSILVGTGGTGVISRSAKIL